VARGRNWTREKKGKEGLNVSVEKNVRGGKENQTCVREKSSHEKEAKEECVLAKSKGAAVGSGSKNENFEMTAGSNAPLVRTLEKRKFR